MENFVYRVVYKNQLGGSVTFNYETLQDAMTDIEGYIRDKIDSVGESMVGFEVSKQEDI